MFITQRDFIKSTKYLKTFIQGIRKTLNKISGI